MRKFKMQLIIRNLKRHKMFSMINILGFAIGIAVFIIISGYVNHQLSFDKFHSKHKQIYKVFVGKYQNLPPALSHYLKDNIAAIDDVVRMDDWYGGGDGGYIIEGENKIKTDNLVYVDSSFFDFFDFVKVTEFDSNGLKTPNNIVLTESNASKIFGNEDPVGKSFLYCSNYGNLKQTFTVLGVIEDPPANSSIQYNGLVSMSTISYHGIRRKNMDADWNNWGFDIFIRVTDPLTVDRLNDETPGFWTNFIADRWNAEPGSISAQDYQLKFVPLDEVHFTNNNNRSFVYLISLVGLIILVVAILNYINLSLVISGTRRREIGIRRVVGSNRVGLFIQFLSESIIITFISALIALIIAYFLQPFLFEFTGFKSLIDANNALKFLLIFVTGVLIVGILSGLYPALYLSRLEPKRTLKSEIFKLKGVATIKPYLVISQFTLSIFLLIGMLIISKQVNFMRSEVQGFNSEQILYFHGSNVDKSYDAFREALLKNSNVYSVSRTNQTFGNPLYMSGKVIVNGEERVFKGTTVDPSFIETFGIDLIEGSNLSWDNKAYNTALVNESFVHEMDLDHVVGSEVNFRGHNVKIIGVVKDFHYDSFHHTIEPSLFWYGPMNVLINAKINEANIGSTIGFIKKVRDEFAPGVPFEYDFLSDRFAEVYKSDIVLNILLKIFSALTIFIACMGLFGLISFSAGQRGKEISIRKINGARIFEIVSMLNRDTLKYILIAFVISCPPAYYATMKWLENFAYKTNVSWWIFAVAGVLALVIALLTVSFQSWKAATRNPVEALRYE